MDAVDVVAISTSVKEDAETYPPSTWFAERGWPWDVMLDDNSDTAAGLYDARSLPSFLLADADGIVLDRTSGPDAYLLLVGDIERALGAG